LLLLLLAASVDDDVACVATATPLWLAMTVIGTRLWLPT
jgi:hypothetical protein